MKPQEVFDLCVTKMFQQGKFSADEGGNCFYRFNDACCIVGQRITDEEYLPELEGLPAELVAWKLGWDDPGETTSLMRRMQRVHDKVLLRSPRGASDHTVFLMLKEELAAIARIDNLNANALNTPWGGEKS